MVESLDLSEGSQYKRHLAPVLCYTPCAVGEVIQEQFRKGRWNPKYDD